MPISETGISISSRTRAVRRRSRGFSLMEIMVVIAIIGLVSAMVIVQFSGSSRDSELDKEAERLEALFSYAREQAELQTRDYGFRVTSIGYSFVVFDVIAEEWRLAEEDDALRERQFPEGIEPLVVVEGRAVVLDHRKKEIEDFSPHVLIFANGDVSSFEVFLHREGSEARARIYTDEQTNIRLLLPGEVEEKGPPLRAAATR
jgi:type II secretion system protein H